MDSILVPCVNCGKKIKRSPQRINESQKNNWKTYCSRKCQSLAKNLQIEAKCYRDGCSTLVKRKKSEFNRFKVIYCSRRCAALVNNKKYPRKRGVTKICAFCSKPFKSRQKYCSFKCKNNAAIIPKDKLLKKINDFFQKESRVPFKNEIGNYHAFRSRFGSWNEAIKKAGLRPNPVMFANRHLAKDGHECDSLAEKIIDDWLFKRKIKHTRRIPYPGGQHLTADFMINNYWIEFFGLYGEHKRYDQLRNLKLKIAKDHKLKLIEIYPKDLFPKNKLETILKNFVKH